ncbi:hypothetical protein Acr_08g0000390 [Actinidia rufa]|uniref:CCHC-type domain-containing protein n=1 Tax=Actinidia rufa TaxID=165716 RepID=A0A7J0EZ44_9ERIC|nr:hypothetical protein Acr_08g0000390 [Actinidia rufa]
MRKLQERPSPGVSSVSFNRRLSKYCAICSKQSLPFCLENPTMVSLDYTRSAKSVITVAMIAVRFILIGPQSMRMRAVKMKPMPMKFLVVGVIKEVVVRGVVAKGIMINEVECKQGIQTSEVYTEEFYRLSARNNLQESEDQQIARFVNGLRVAIRDQFSNRGKQPVPSPQSQPVTNSGSQTKAVTIGSITRQGGNPNPYTKASGDKCYRCGEPGHRSNTCPKRAIVNLVEPVPEEEDGGDDEGDADPYSYDPNEFQYDEEGEYLGRSLNDRKVVLGPLKESSVPKVPKEEGKSSVLLVHNEDEFDKEARESKQIFVMVLTEEAPKTPSEVPVAVQPLIKEF